MSSKEKYKKNIIIILLFFVLLATNYVLVIFAQENRTIVFQKNYTKALSESEWLPKWMPSHWCRELLNRIAEKKIEPNFNNSLEKIGSRLNEISWVDSVEKISRNYRGDFKVNIKIKTPICLIQINKKVGYLDKSGDYMKPLSNKNLHILNDGRVLPVINANKLTPSTASKDEMRQAFDDLIRYLIKWESEASVKGRYELNSIEMLPYKKRSFFGCRFILNLSDKKYRKPTQVVWGISQNENALESRTGEHKWADFRNAVARGGYNNSLDLRYNVSKTTL